MSKTIALSCEPPLIAILLQALRTYIDVAYPAGSSDCALVARDALLDALHALEAQQRAAAGCHYNRYLRAMLKEAVKLHYRAQAHEQGHDCSHQCAIVLDACSGLPRTALELQAAQALDEA